MSQVDLVVRSRRAVLPEGVRAAAVHVAGGRIAAVAGYDDVPEEARVLEAGDFALLPGLVDTHVHVNEPGRTEWEGFRTATRAAAAGGITTLVDMPLNSVPATTTAAALAAKRAAAAGQCRVDVRFWGGVVPGNEGELSALREAGALGFKAFLVPSGVDEFPAVGEAELARALPILAELGAPLLVHAELPGPIAAAAARLAGADPRAYSTWLLSRPPVAEVEAVELLVLLARATGARIHVVHVAAAEVLPLLAAARAEGLAVSGETCPHYLTFCAEEVPDGATEYKCAPPVRDASDREALWAALADGILALVASDHSPSPPLMKRRSDGDFMAAWGGIASLQVSLPAVWTEARRRGHGIAELAEWMSRAPAALAGLDAHKGAIRAGLDADLVVFDPEAELTVDGARLEHRHPLTPYHGRRLAGVVRQTLLRGELVYDGGRFAQLPTGELLRP
ncbi:MAG TPA: allantoinase AllB [Thermoanaerobaculia bacterium]|nr:allantoinase AllB [Thermoanaerobaculia bacterium]